jgi:hypothetical protein
MQQLSGLDASFLYMETPNAPMHISGLAPVVYPDFPLARPPTGSQPSSLGGLRY